MMHYRKGTNVEEQPNRSQLPFDDCLGKGENTFLWMHIKGSTKVSNVINLVKNALDKGSYRTLVWSGRGGGVVKTISCAEILKRSYPLYQVTRMRYSSVDEHWEPQMPGLDGIVAKRQIPNLHILMSLDELDASIIGLQKPNTTAEFWCESNANPGSTRPDRQQQQQQQQLASADVWPMGAGNQPRNRRARPNKPKPPRQQTFRDGPSKQPQEDMNF